MGVVADGGEGYFLVEQERLSLILRSGHRLLLILGDRAVMVIGNDHIFELLDLFLLLYLISKALQGNLFL